MVQSAAGVDDTIQSCHGLAADQEALRDDNICHVRLIMVSVESIDFFHEDSIDLLEGVRDIARSIWSLWSKCKIRHRDISINNVKIALAHRTAENLERLRRDDLELATSDGGTRLSAELLGLGNAVIEGTRSGADCPSGTTAFMSIRMGQELSAEHRRQDMERLQANNGVKQNYDLEGISKNIVSQPHTIGDDLEGLFYVLLWALAEQKGSSVLTRWTTSASPTAKLQHMEAPPFVRLIQELCPDHKMRDLLWILREIIFTRKNNSAPPRELPDNDDCK